MYKILLVVLIFTSTLIANDDKYSDNPNLFLKKSYILDDGSSYLSKKRTRGRTTTQTIFTKIKIENSIKFEDMLGYNFNWTSKDFYEKHSEKNTPYVFVSSNKYPFFRIIRGYIYRTVYTRNGSYHKKVIVGFNDEVSLSSEGTSFKLKLSDLSGYVWASPAHDAEKKKPYLPNIMLRNYSFDKSVEWIKQRGDPYSSYIEDKYSYLAAIEIRPITIKKFGKKYKKYATRYYTSSFQGIKYPVYAIAFDKKGVQDIANYMCRKGFNLKLGKENGWDWKLVAKKFPQVNNKLFKCKKSLDYYMQDDELWKEFLQKYK